MSRTPATVQAEMLALKPPGRLSRRPDSNFGMMLLPQATEISRWEGEAEAMIPEIDPRRCFYTLPDWEAEMGPDPYGVDTSGFDTGQMQQYLYQRLTMKGGQSPAYYEALAASFGVMITITEIQQSIYGGARYGSRYCNSPNQFAWLVTMPETTTSYARYGSARYGDRYSSYTPNPVQAIIAAQAPAHTQPVFSYTE